MENQSIVGADFMGIRGNCFIVAAYETNQLLRYKITQKKQIIANDVHDANKF